MYAFQHIPAIYMTSGLPLPPNSKLNKPSNRKNFISLLQRSKHINQILSIQATIIKNGQNHDPFIVFELIRLCSTNFNSIDYATKIFHNTPNPNVFIYTALLDGFVSSGSYLDGIRLYSRMADDSISPDGYAITSVLKACAFQLDLKVGKEVHGRAVKLGLSSNRSVRLKLVELYGKCGEFDAAVKVFDEMPERDDVVASTVLICCYANYGLVDCASDVFNRVCVKDTVCWTAMIDGFVRHGEMNRALELFREMQMKNMRPNEVTIVCVLSACSQLGALELGRWVHSYMKKYAIKLNHVVGSALINMYSRCGSIDEAELVFYEMKQRDASTYNSMIAGFAMHGNSIKAIEIFKAMMKRGIRPNPITFVGVFNACSHGGMVDLGFKMFHSMKRDYGIEPQIEHYGCMVDLLCRVGHLEEAFNFVSKMNIAPDHIMLGSLLSACKIHKNLELGERVAKTLIDCGDADCGTYVLLSNVYASLGKWNEAVEVRAKMKEGRIQKKPGCSSIEVNNEIHEFLLGDLKHPKKEEIYKKLEELNQRVRLDGYSPSTEVILQDIEGQENEGL